MADNELADAEAARKAQAELEAQQRATEAAQQAANATEEEDQRVRQEAENNARKRQGEDGWRKEIVDKLAVMEQRHQEELATLKSQTNKALKKLEYAESTNSELQEAYLTQRLEMRKAEKAKIMGNFQNAASKRTVGFITEMLYDVEDIREAFANLFNEDTDPFDEKHAEAEAGPLVTPDNAEEVDVALKSCLLTMGELKQKMKAELLAHECAEKAGGKWGAVAFLENKDLKKMAGDSIAEKEEKMLLIRKAEEEFQKHAKAMKMASPKDKKAGKNC